MKSSFENAAHIYQNPYAFRPTDLQNIQQKHFETICRQFADTPPDMKAMVDVQKRKKGPESMNDNKSLLCKQIRDNQSIDVCTVYELTPIYHKVSQTLDETPKPEMLEGDKHLLCALAFIHTNPSPMSLSYSSVSEVLQSKVSSLITLPSRLGLLPRDVPY